MKPPKSILDPAFKYTNSAQTDLRKTFARVRKEMKLEDTSSPSSRGATVMVLPERKKPCPQ